MCRGRSSQKQCWHQPASADAAAMLLRAAAAAARQPMKSLLPRPLATCARVNLNLVWDDMERVMAAGDPLPLHTAAADNLRNEWLEQQVKDHQAGRPSHQQAPR